MLRRGDLSDAAREAIGAAQATLRAAAPRADVAWVDAGELHLTLKFLGEIDETTEAAIETALGETALVTGRSRS